MKKLILNSVKMTEYILLTEKLWYDGIFEVLSKRPGEIWHRIAKREDLNAYILQKINPAKIFIPHWSYIIPAEIYENYICVVFHMTDLPYGRGGSPLQNLIVAGKTETKICAIKVQKGLDTGDIYTKRKLDLAGSASEIFSRTAPLIKEMIEEIINSSPPPWKQVGEVVVFKRRIPADSDISKISELDKIYDHIRMMDAEDYSAAYIENENLKFEFFNAEKINNEILANVRIIKK